MADYKFATVQQLIEFLQKHPPEMQVAYACCSEQCLLELDDIRVAELCEPRPDGWIQNKRGDKPLRQFLLFPGN